MTGFDDSSLTRDAFLGGRLRICQPRQGYRAGIDPVLLAAAVPATPGDSVLELGCGAGVASLCLAARVPGVQLTGVERQADYAALARQNAALNGIAMQVTACDLQHLPAELRALNFDHVIANPPYFPAHSRSPAQDSGREMGRGEETPLAAWIDVAVRRLRPRGWLTVIHDAARLPDLLCALDPRLGDVTVQPLAGRVGRAAHLVLLQARKGARGPFRLCAPLILHDGAAHDGDRDSYTPEISAILRDGGAFPPLRG